MRLPRALEYSAGLFAVTYLVMQAILLWSASRGFAFQSRGVWEYLRSNPETVVAAAVPSGAMFVAGLVAYTITRAAGSAPPRAAMLTLIVPFIAFPLTALAMSADFIQDKS